MNLHVQIVSISKTTWYFLLWLGHIYCFHNKKKKVNCLKMNTYSNAMEPLKLYHCTENTSINVFVGEK